jgi:MerR family glutamine synthetase transcriptional repressor
VILLATNDSIYPISAVMSMTNLTARQIRYYESHGLISPTRSKGNQRLYTPSDVENLLMIKSLLEKGLNLDGIKSIFAGNQPAEGSKPPVVPDSPAESILNSNNPAFPKLTSLYPVNNQEALTKWLQSKRK